MKIDLKKYYEGRDLLAQNTAFDGPVLTFSRQYGCEGNRIARMMVKEINDRPRLQKKHPWQYISKEIIEDSAKELGLKPSVVDLKVQQYDADPVRSLFASLGQHYDISESKIIEKINEIILTYAKKGNIIIVGRGGSFVTEGIERVLRVRLVAPIDWRVENVSRSMKISLVNAAELIKKMDANRIKWIENISGRKFDQSTYDLIINVKTMDDHEISEMILNLMERREFIAVASKYAVHA